MSTNVTFTGVEEHSSLYDRVLEILRSDVAGQALQDHLNLTPIPPGTVSAWAGDTTKTATIPGGWLPCDGRAVSRTAYAALFRVIGVNFGQGDGRSTFTLPDLRGRVPVGAGLGGVSFTNRVIGATGGEEVHLLTAAESGVPAHTHLGPGTQLLVGGGTGNANITTGGGGYNNGSNTVQPNAASSASSAHNNMPPFSVLSYLIKV